jgi:hypothetical protein
MLYRILATMALLACFAVPLSAQAAQSNETTITGQVVDVTCFTHGQSGAGHKMCAEACAKAGVQLGILGSDGTLYMPISDKAADPTNPRLVPFVEGKVRVTGKHKLVNGLHTIELKSIAAAS